MPLKGVGQFNQRFNLFVIVTIVFLINKTNFKLSKSYSVQSNNSQLLQHFSVLGIGGGSKKDG
jgi:hypothetical protein